MEKRKGVSKLIVSILLLMILMIYIVTSIELYKSGEPERASTIISLLMNVVKQLLMWHLSSLERTALGFFRTSDMK